MIYKGLRKIRRGITLLLTIWFLFSQMLIASPALAASQQATASDSLGIARLAGGDRYQTAVAISQEGWEKSDNAVIARGDLFPDALSAGPLAFAINAPILLTPQNKLNEDTRRELKRLKVKTVIIIGGESAISTPVADEIAAGGINVERIGGITRYDTSVAVANRLSSSNSVILATGKNFPDALSISAIAAKFGIPILLTEKDALPQEVETYLKSNNINKTYLVGGLGVISAAVEQVVPNPVRLAGVDRYDTNINILKHFTAPLNFSKIHVASGTSFPDALTGAVLAATGSSPLILAGKTLAPLITAYLSSHLKLDTKIYGFGGKEALSADILLSILNSKINIAVSEHYREAGIYGPASGTATVAGSAIISSRGITLRNTVIEGDLLLASTIGNGDVVLNNVTVKGKTIINGGVIITEPVEPPETNGTADNPYYIDLKLIPEDAYDIFKAKYPNARVKEIELDVEKNSYVYEVEGYEGSIEYEIKINPYDGKIIKVEKDNDNKTKGEIKREDLSKIPAILKKAVEVVAKEGFKLKSWSVEIEGDIIEFEIEFISDGKKIEHKYNLKTGELIKIKHK